MAATPWVPDIDHILEVHCSEPPTWLARTIDLYAPSIDRSSPIACMACQASTRTALAPSHVLAHAPPTAQARDVYEDSSDGSGNNDASEEEVDSD